MLSELFSLEIEEQSDTFVTLYTSIISVAIAEVKVAHSITWTVN